MPANRSSIYQFGALKRLQSLLSGAAEKQSACNAIEEPDVRRDAVPGGERSVDPQHPIDERDVKHFIEHWIEGDYWPNIGPETIRDRIAEGFAAALSDADDQDLPVIPVWVRANEDAGSRDFRVDHVVTETAVVVAIITPQPNR